MNILNPYRFTDSAAKIISYYKLDNNADDFVGLNNGIPTNITYTTGVVNNAGDFNGFTSRIITFNPVGLSFGNGTTDSPFSISFWIKGSDLSNNPRLFDRRNVTDGLNREYRVIIAGSLLSFLLFDNSTGGNIGKGTVSTIPLNTWVYFTLTYDGSGTVSGIKIYKNGNLEATTDIINGTYTAMEALGEPLTIGKDAQFPNALNGQMDEISFWDNELTENEITEIYNKNLSGLPLI